VDSGEIFEHRRDKAARERQRMTDHERQAITARLVELGFWETGEPGDPVGDYHDAKTLHARVSARLTVGASAVSMSASSHSSARQVLILYGERLYPLGAADNYPESICLAALALPQFLDEHPECAADQERGRKT
jgi:hypothetical protein